MSSPARPGETPTAVMAGQLDALRRTLDALAPTVETVRAAGGALTALAGEVERRRTMVAEAAGCLAASLEVAARHPHAWPQLAADLSAALEGVREDTAAMAASVAHLSELAAAEARGELEPDALDAFVVAFPWSYWRTVPTARPGRSGTAGGCLTTARRVFLRTLRTVSASAPKPQPARSTTRRYCRRTYTGAARSDDPSPPCRQGALLGASTPGQGRRERGRAPT